MIDTVTKYYLNGQHAGYIVTHKNSNRTLSVPVAEDNTDYQAILKWVAEGNVIEEAD